MENIQLLIYLIVIGVVVFIMYMSTGTSLFNKNISVKNKIIGVIETIFIFFSIYGAYQLKNFEMTKEVSLKSVPVQGTKNFIATIRIEYVDGHFERVTLVPGTTIEEK